VVPIQVAWPGDKCILCLTRSRLTLEHIIPDILGGRLSSEFLCASCNSRLGSEVEAQAKHDPGITLAIGRFSNSDTAFARRFQERINYVVDSEGGRRRAKLVDREPRIRSERLPDGSLVMPTDKARESIATILTRQGLEGAALQKAVQAFDGAEENERVRIAENLEVVKWAVTGLAADLSGSKLSPLVPLKIVYEFLALSIGGAIYGASPPLEAIREALSGGTVDSCFFRVERALANRSDPIHGIMCEATAPESVFQVRLFGSIAFRIVVPTLRGNWRRLVYTQSLNSDEEGVGLLDQSPDPPMQPNGVR
jgi:hypothetical protein